MPASLERIRDEISIEPTPQDKGLTLTITVTAYDNGLVTVNGNPMSGDETLKWMGAAELTSMHLREFRRQFEQRPTR